MNPIRIRVNKQTDGFTFSLLPLDKKNVTEAIPSAYPADLIFIAFQMQSDFKQYYPRLENHVLPMLLGVENKEDLEKLDEVLFIDTFTKEVLHKITHSHD